MDNTERLPSVLSICTGYGGIEIGLERAIGTINILAHVEIEAYAVANLLAKMGTGDLVPAPVWTDIKTFQAHCFSGSVDILTGGYPCQPFSTAGQRRGSDDTRHLWPWIKEHISIIRPGICFFENVEGHVSLGLREVLTDLADLGYRVESDSGEPTWGLFSAAECGAPHQRKRVFILAYRDLSWVALCRNNGGMGRQSEQNEEMGSAKGDNQRREDQAPWVSGAIVANSCQQGPQNTELKTIQSAWRRNERRTTTQFCFSLWPSRPGDQQYEWEEPRDFDGKLNPDWVESLQGVPPGWTQLSNALPGENRIDRLRLLGNGVVPATAEKAFITLLNRIKKPGINREQVEIQMELF